MTRLWTVSELFHSFPPHLLQTSLRDKMLNDYIHKKEQMGTVMKNIDEVIKLKRLVNRLKYLLGMLLCGLFCFTHH